MEQPAVQLCRLFRIGHAEIEYECPARDLKIPGQHVEGQMGMEVEDRFPRS